MARVVLSAVMRPYTGGVDTIDVPAGRYTDLVDTLRGRFPTLPEEIISNQAIAIDGRVIQQPLLESFRADSELVFVARIAGG